MKTFEGFFYGYVIKEAGGEGRYVHQDRGWTVLHGRRLFTRSEAMKFINEHERQRLIILRG
jgi:hypothetical protein